MRALGVKAKADEIFLSLAQIYEDQERTDEQIAQMNVKKLQANNFMWNKMKHLLEDK